jgi:hypothetical protein
MKHEDFLELLKILIFLIWSVLNVNFEELPVDWFWGHLHIDSKSILEAFNGDLAYCWDSSKLGLWLIKSRLKKELWKIPFIFKLHSNLMNWCRLGDQKCFFDRLPSKWLCCWCQIPKSCYLNNNLNFEIESRHLCKENMVGF